jgi:hypothetical protein
LEFNVFTLEGDDSIGEFSGEDGLIGGFFVDLSDEVNSQEVESCDDLLEGILVGEVLFGGELEEGLDDGGEFGVILELVVEVLDVTLDLFDLDEGRVGDGGEELKALINGGNGLVVISNSGFEGSLIVGSGLGLGGEGVSVGTNVGLQHAEGVCDSISLGCEDIVIEVYSVEDFSLGVFNELLELTNLLVVLSSASIEVGVGLTQLSIEVYDDFFDGADELLKITLGLEVEFSEIKDPCSHLGLTHLSERLLLVACEDLVDVDGNGCSNEGEEEKGLHFSASAWICMA